MLVTTLMRRKVFGTAVLAASVFLAGGMSSCPNNNNNNGNGEFARIAISTVSDGGASSVTVADLDGDDLDDLVSTWSDAGEVQLHMQAQAAGQVGWSTVTLASGSAAAGARCAAVGDISGDGRLDIFVGTDEGHILYLRQTGSNPGALSNWTTSLIAAAEGSDPWTSIILADVDGDGQKEIVASQAGDAHRVSILNPPLIALDGSGWTRVDIATSGRDGAGLLMPIDMDGDGDIDVISLASDEDSDSLVWYANPGTLLALLNSWTRHPIGHVADPQGAALADIDGDGYYDLVVSSGSGKSVSWFQAPSTLDDLLDSTKRWSQFTVGSLGSGNGGPLAVTDIDDDGVYDIVVGTTGSAKLTSFEYGLTSWTETVLNSTAGDYTSLVPVDLDGDGATDIVATQEGDSSVVVWYQQQQD